MCLPSNNKIATQPGAHYAKLLVAHDSGPQMKSTRNTTHGTGIDWNIYNTYIHP